MSKAERAVRSDPLDREERMKGHSLLYRDNLKETSVTHDLFW